MDRKEAIKYAVIEAARKCLTPIGSPADYGSWLADDFERALAEAGYAIEQDWRPIGDEPDTLVAPWDGKPVLVCNSESAGEACYHVGHEGFWWANTHPTDYFDGKVWMPTHWRPIPKVAAARK